MYFEVCISITKCCLITLAFQNMHFETSATSQFWCALECLLSVLSIKWKLVGADMTTNFHLWCAGQFVIFPANLANLFTLVVQKVTITQQFHGYCTIVPLSNVYLSQCCWFRTRGFCWCKAIEPKFPCWWQLGQLDWEEHTELLSGVVYTINMPYVKSNIHTHNCLTAVCPELPGWAGTRRNIQPLTPILTINILYQLPLSTMIHSILLQKATMFNK